MNEPRRVVPQCCDLDSAIDTGIACARRLQQDVTVQWGAVAFRVNVTDDPKKAYASYMKAAALIRAAEQTARPHRTSKDPT